MTCPHCGALTSAGAYCESCGKALPSAAPMGPRVVGADAMPTSLAGQKLMGDELKKLMNRAAYTLLAVGLLQVTCGAVAAAFVSNQQANIPPELMGTLKLLFIVQFLAAGLFVGLFFWARMGAPLAASIVGLVVYATFVGLNIVASVSQFKQAGRQGTGIGGIGIGWLDIVVIAFLVQGIQAGLKYKKITSGQAV